MSNFSVVEGYTEIDLGRIHDLKCWPRPFHDTLSGKKTFEIRVNDRNFRVGDTLLLREWDNGIQEYTGNQLYRMVAHIEWIDEWVPVSNGSQYVVMGLEDIE